MPTTATSTLDASLARTSDFPERLGPVLIKELRQGLRSGFFAIPFAVLPAVLGLQTLWALLLDDPSSGRDAVSGLFWASVVLPLLVLTPMRALGSIRSERDAQTLELLQLTSLTAWKIVSAKWCSLMAQALLWLMAILPFFVLRYYFGGINLVDESQQLVAVVLAGGVLTALAIFASTLPRLLHWLFVAGSLFSGFASFVFALESLFTGRFFRGVPAGANAPLVFVVWSIGVLYVTLLALIYAASRIAPPAENYHARLRFGLIGLFGFWGLVATTIFAGHPDEHWPIFFVAAVFLVLLTATHTGGEQSILAVHLAPWRRFGRTGLLVARFFVPGWPSAILFLSVMSIVSGAALALFSNEPFSVLVAIALAWITLVMPRGLQCLFLRDHREHTAFHIAVHAAGPIGAIFLSMFRTVMGDAIVFPAALLPSSLWWLLLPNESLFRESRTIVAGVAATWVFILAGVFIIRSAPYRARFRKLAGSTT